MNGRIPDTFVPGVLPEREYPRMVLTPEVLEEIERCHPEAADLINGPPTPDSLRRLYEMYTGQQGGLEGALQVFGSDRVLGRIAGREDAEELGDEPRMHSLPGRSQHNITINNTRVNWDALFRRPADQLRGANLPAVDMQPLSQEQYRQMLMRYRQDRRYLHTLQQAQREMAARHHPELRQALLDDVCQAPEVRDVMHRLDPDDILRIAEEELANATDDEIDELYRRHNMEPPPRREPAPATGTVALVSTPRTRPNVIQQMWEDSLVYGQSTARVMRDPDGNAVSVERVLPMDSPERPAGAPFTTEQMERFRGLLGRPVNEETREEVDRRVREFLAEPLEETGDQGLIPAVRDVRSVDHGDGNIEVMATVDMPYPVNRRVTQMVPVHARTGRFRVGDGAISVGSRVQRMIQQENEVTRMMENVRFVDDGTVLDTFAAGVLEET